MTALPPNDGPIWKRMEEDVADERWPVPTLFGWLWFWYRGPRNEIHRRAAYLRGREWMSRSSLIRWILLLALTLAQLWRVIHPSPSLNASQTARGLPFLLAIFLICAWELYVVSSALWFTLSAHRYFGGLASWRERPGQST
jgi:hypothetical protein